MRNFPCFSIYDASGLCKALKRTEIGNFYFISILHKQTTGKRHTTPHHIGGEASHLSWNYLLFFYCTFEERGEKQAWQKVPKCERRQRNNEWIKTTRFSSGFFFMQLGSFASYVAQRLSIMLFVLVSCHMSLLPMFAQLTDESVNWHFTSIKENFVKENRKSSQSSSNDVVF